MDSQIIRHMSIINNKLLQFNKLINIIQKYKIAIACSTIKHYGV